MKFVKSLSILALAASAFSASAMADGFNCQTTNGDLILKIYNHVNAADGTRTGSVLVISDPALPAGERTIARFSDANGTLTSSGASYDAKVDLRFNDSNQKDARVLDTTLGRIEKIRATVFFSYDSPVAAGTHVGGLLQIRERDGGSLKAGLDCVRYLKGE